MQSRLLRASLGILVALSLESGEIVQPLEAETFTVTNTSDPGTGSCSLSVCSLRDAISAANANPGIDTVAFSIPGAGVHTIQPLTSLPALTDPVVIDATTQNPSSPTPLIELRGDEVNADSGLTVSASDVTIKGLIINSFPSSGIFLSGASGTTIVSNWIGLDSTGLLDRGNAIYGIELSNSTNNIIGAANGRNVISGSGSYGIYIGDAASSGNQIRGNYIGTNYLGAAAVANTGGIAVLSSNNTIGGSSAGEGNLITGIGSFPLYQIYISESNGNVILGNLIGTNAAGDASLSTDDEGVFLGAGIHIIDGKDNVIGEPGSGNIIAGNGTGIELKGGFTEGLSTSNNLIRSNYIGTNPSGSAVIPNYNGIVIFGVIFNPVSDNTIGGINSGTAIYGNVISGNGTGVGTGRGIQMIGPLVRNNSIQGNFIGTLRDGVTPLGNTGPGILLDAIDTLIGGADGAGNIIAYNGESGVAILSGTGNKISRNSMFKNGGLGIDAGFLFGANPTDPGDSDEGPNNFQNFPEFGITTPGSEKILVKGALDSTPLQSFTLEFFLNNEVDDSGYGEGETYLGSETVVTNSEGKAAFSLLFTAALPKNGSVTATATDIAGNSSEFSLSVQPTRVLKEGAVIDKPPVVAIVDEVVTVSVPLFKAPKKASAASELPATGGTRRPVIRYEVTVKSETDNSKRRLISKKNIVSYKNLPPGNYQASYRAKVTRDQKPASKTRTSPPKPFTVS